MEETVIRPAVHAVWAGCITVSDVVEYRGCCGLCQVPVFGGTFVSVCSSVSACCTWSLVFSRSR